MQGLLVLKRPNQHLQLFEELLRMTMWLRPTTSVPFLMALRFGLALFPKVRLHKDSTPALDMRSFL